jgi:hypothetical protein
VTTEPSTIIRGYKRLFIKAENVNRDIGCNKRFKLVTSVGLARNA